MSRYLELTKYGKGKLGKGIDLESIESWEYAGTSVHESAGTRIDVVCRSGVVKKYYDKEADFLYEVLSSMALQLV